MDQTARVTITKIEKDEARQRQDLVAIEEPLQITVDGTPIAVVMRTPGDDADLVMGFLLTEGIVDSRGAVMRIDLEWKQNHALVFLADDVYVDLARLQRNLYSASSCGICGKASIDEVFLHIKNQDADFVRGKFFISRKNLTEAPDKLKRAQEVFELTGGLHAAGLFNQDGELLCIREDVGRHNAIDKVIGKALADGLDLTNVMLQLSGRVSFEVVQKSLMVGIPFVSAISAPTSLAIDFAKQGNLTLVGFMRGENMNVYSCPERIV